MPTKYDWTRIDNDVNGNPRYVTHFLNLLTPQEKDFDSPYYAGVIWGYELAIKRANTIGGRKYHTRHYGGGIVFQSYSLGELEAAIDRAIASAQTKEGTA